MRNDFGPWSTRTDPRSHVCYGYENRQRLFEVVSSSWLCIKWVHITCLHFESIYIKVREETKYHYQSNCFYLLNKSRKSSMTDRMTWWSKSTSESLFRLPVSKIGPVASYSATFFEEGSFQIVSCELPLLFQHNNHGRVCFVSIIP